MKTSLEFELSKLYVLTDVEYDLERQSTYQIPKINSVDIVSILDQDDKEIPPTDKLIEAITVECFNQLFVELNGEWP